MTRAEQVLSDMKSLRPTSFTIDDLDSELVAMSLLDALPDSYDPLIKALMVSDDLSLEKIKSSLQNEETSQLIASDNNSTSTLALRASGTSNSSSTPSQSLICSFCGKSNHAEDVCYAKRDASKLAKEQAANRLPYRSNKPKGRQNANEAQATAPSTPAAANISQVEFAGNASDLQSSLSPPSSNWNTDTGATAHMTPQDDQG